MKQERKRKFETLIEPVNEVINNGWKIEHYGLFVAGSCQTVMKKKVNEESEVKEGMKLKEE